MLNDKNESMILFKREAETTTEPKEIDVCEWVYAGNEFNSDLFNLGCMTKAGVKTPYGLPPGSEVPEKCPECGKPVLDKGNEAVSGE